MSLSDIKRPFTGASVLAIRGKSVVIVRRGKEPSKGMWALPGGSQEFGETLEQAARRELTEETSLIATDMQFLQFIEPMAMAEDGSVVRHFVLGIFFALEPMGDLLANDDAADAHWVLVEDLDQYDLTESSRKIILQHFANK